MFRLYASADSGGEELVKKKKACCLWRGGDLMEVRGRLLVVVGGGRWVSGSVREKMILKMVMSESWKWCSPA